MDPQGRDRAGCDELTAAGLARCVLRVSSRHSSFLARRHLGEFIHPPQGGAPLKSGAAARRPRAA